MKWHITIETAEGIYKFDITVESLRVAFIPLLRKMDLCGITQEDVVQITMERQND